MYSSGQYKVYVPYSYNDRSTKFIVQEKGKIFVQHLRATVSWERNFYVFTETKTEKCVVGNLLKSASTVRLPDIAVKGFLDSIVTCRQFVDCWITSCI